MLDRTPTPQSSAVTAADLEKSGRSMDVEGNGNGNGATPHPGAFDVSPARRTVLLGVFSLAIALDIVNVSALLTTTETIANDLGLVAGNVTWIITAYSMTFASFMLFAGRLADLFPAQWLFEGGLFLLGILMIVLSFIRNKYAFLVIRALQGICGAMTVPSAYHLIVHLFTDRHQQQMALAALGLAGAIANSIGVVLGGLFELGNSSWPWLFRFLAIVALIACAVGWLMMPKAFTPKNKSQYTKFQQMDLVGVFLLTGSLLLFILGLTSGTTDGWTDAHFLAPFLISVAMFVGFFLWERTLPDERALLPMGVWRLPNLPLLAFAAVSPYMFWGTTQLGFANYWQSVHGATPILASARLLPEGIAGLIGGMVVQVIPKLLSRPKYTMIGGQLLAGVGLILLIFSQGGNGDDYWRFVFTGFVIGSFGAILTFLALNVSIVQAVPPQASGVAGALLQVCLQIGAVIGLSVQAGLYSRVDNDLSNWKGSQFGFWFIFAWMIITGIAILIFFRPEKSAKVLEQLEEQQEVKQSEKAPQAEMAA